MRTGAPEAEHGDAAEAKEVQQAAIKKVRLKLTRSVPPKPEEAAELRPRFKVVLKRKTEQVETRTGFKRGKQDIGEDHGGHAIKSDSRPGKVISADGPTTTVFGEGKASGEICTVNRENVTAVHNALAREKLVLGHSGSSEPSPSADSMLTQGMGFVQAEGGLNSPQRQETQATERPPAKATRTPLSFAKRSPLPLPSSAPAAIRSALPLLSTAPVAVRSTLSAPSAVRSPLPLSGAASFNEKVDEFSKCDSDVDTQGFPSINLQEDCFVHFEDALLGQGNEADFIPDPVAWAGQDDDSVAAEMVSSALLESPQVDPDVYGSGLLETRKRGPGSRAVYRCRRCLAPKKGHKCPFESGGDEQADGIDTRRTQKRPMTSPLPEAVQKKFQRSPDSLADDEKSEMSCSSGRSGLSSKPTASKSAFKDSEQASDGSSKLKAKTGSDVHWKDFMMSSKWLLESGVLEGVNVRYIAKTGELLGTGVVRDGSIFCGCRQCKGSKSFGASSFEKHLGSTARHPSDYIFLENGNCLRDVLEAGAKWKKKADILSALRAVISSEARAGTELCTKCRKGGDVSLRCSKKGCSNKYHQGCAVVATQAAGSWCCPQCSRPETREANNKVEGGLPDGDQGQNIGDGRRLEETILCGCTLCRNPDFEKCGFSPMTMLLCDQCEKEFHVGCLKEHGLADLKELPEGEWYCGKDCRHVRTILDLLLRGDEQLVSAKVTVHLSAKRVPDDLSDLSWELLHVKAPKKRVVLSEAFDIISNNFAPIVDPLSGQNLLPLMLYSGSIRDQDFRGMYCIVLKHRGIVVSAAMLRVFGKALAEMPLVATKKEMQGMGYFQILFRCIEILLGLLRVDQIALPAADGAEGIWLDKFGFWQMPKDELQKFREEVQLTFFAGSSVLKRRIKHLPLPSSQKFRKLATLGIS